MASSQLSGCSDRSNPSLPPAERRMSRSRSSPTHLDSQVSLLPSLARASQLSLSELTRIRSTSRTQAPAALPVLVSSRPLIYQHLLIELRRRWIWNCHHPGGLPRAVDRLTHHLRSGCQHHRVPLVCRRRGWSSRQWRCLPTVQA